jgi:hypothetical protein
VGKWWGLQKCEVNEERILEDYVRIYDAFFAQRHRLRKQNFCEVRFADLERDPMGQMKHIYESLELPKFDHAMPAVRDYVHAVSGYLRNSFPPLPVETRQRVASEWSRSFAEWGYPK